MCGHLHSHLMHCCSDMPQPPIWFLAVFNDPSRMMRGPPTDGMADVEDPGVPA